MALHKGRGVKQDKTKALALMSAAARQGDEHAVRILAKWDSEAAEKLKKKAGGARTSFSSPRASPARPRTSSARSRRTTRCGSWPPRDQRRRGRGAADLEVLIMRADDQQYAATASELAALHPRCDPWPTASR